MSWMYRFFAWIKTWFSSDTEVYRTQEVEELPDQLEDLTIYLVGENTHLWFAAMACPCGCTEVIQLNLIPPRRPRWEVIRHDNRTITLYPSVWRTEGCRSHFWFREGKVDWCSNEIPA